MAKLIPDSRLNVASEVIQVIRCGLHCQEEYYRMITEPSRSEANKATCDFLAKWCDEQEEWLAQDDDSSI